MTDPYPIRETDPEYDPLPAIDREIDAINQAALDGLYDEEES